HLWHVHIGNVVMKDPSMPAYGDVHPRFGFPNSENGVAEVTAFLRALFEVGYLQAGKRPIVSFEVKPVGEEDPLLVIANAKRVLNEAWSKLNL
ncbi:MAG TPA: xylose isomerase, partial [Firmicutes bacterium]|nr:xylose isomerase [Bacillota bacterium]